MDLKPTEEATDAQIIAAAVQVLASRFDAITILANGLRDGRTISAEAGVGNEFSRYGQLTRYLMKVEAEERGEDGNELSFTFGGVDNAN